MMPEPTLYLVRPPYDRSEPISYPWSLHERPHGEAILWRVTRSALDRDELSWVLRRPRGFSLVVVLPPSDEITTIASLLPRLSAAFPRAVLPAGPLSEPPALVRSLTIMPRNLPAAVSEYLTRHRIVQSQAALSEIKRIFELAPRIHTISRLCRELYTSRRTLGRHFEKLDLPVPSHWLQFARLLNVIARAQSEKTAIFKLATRAGYPDGFTLSNQMRRLIGWRPSELRSLYGFEWIVEEWLFHERNRHPSS